VIGASEEVVALRATVRGALGSVWPGASSAGSGDVASAWRVAIAQGWTSLAATDELAALLGIVAELGALACPLPVIESAVAARVLHAAGEPSDPGYGVAVASDDALTSARFVDAADVLDAMVLLPPVGSAATPVTGRIDQRSITSGLAVPSFFDVRIVDPRRLDVSTACLDEARVVIRLGLAVRALAAAEASHRAAIEHATVRVQFGRPIGSFGAVQQRAASCEIDVASGWRLVDEAVGAYAARVCGWELVAEIAVAHISAAAPRVQLGAHHTLAATGYFEGHAAPWLFRRVHADVSRIASFGRDVGRVGDVLIDTGASLPDLDLGADAAAFSNELDTFFDGAAAGLEEPALVAAMAERGYFGIEWPAEYGGRDASPAEQVALFEQATYRRLPLLIQLGAVILLGDSILRHGTTEQKAAFLPLIAGGGLRFCLGYSEPGAGSDLASLVTRAEREGEGWRINGEKLWSTRANIASHVWLATRTNPDAEPRHAGITVFIVAMDTPGITVTEHRSLGAEISCTVRYDDVIVPDTARVGEVDGGWTVITDALRGERILMSTITAGLRRQLDDAVVAIRSGAQCVVGDEVVRDRIGVLAVALQATRVLAAAAITDTSLAGLLAAPMAAVGGAELAEAFGETMLELFGPVATLDGPIEEALRMSVMYVVGGGTNDVQRGLIARGLGLPR
jgi:alkylation response protein AidB-like acyl-CoA dehydrogenase